MADKLLTASSKGRLTGQGLDLVPPGPHFAEALCGLHADYRQNHGLPQQFQFAELEASRSKYGSSFARPQGCTPGA